MVLELNKVFSAYLKTSIYLLALFFIGWGFTAYQRFFLGLIVGTSVAIMSMWFLKRNVEKVSNAVVEGKKVKTIGTLSRFSLAALATFSALFFERYIDIIGVVVGLMASYLVVTINYVLLLKQHSEVGKRGE